MEAVTGAAGSGVNEVELEGDVLLVVIAVRYQEGSGWCIDNCAKAVVSLF